MSLVASANSNIIIEKIPNKPFFPDILLRDFLDAYLIDGTITMPRIIHALIEAVASVNRDLKTFQKKHCQLGAQNLASIDHLDDDADFLVERYRRAVFALAYADLMTRYLGFDASSSANNHFEPKQLLIEEYRQQSRFAVRDILGISRTTVELI